MHSNLSGPPGRRNGCRPTYEGIARCGDPAWVSGALRAGRHLGGPNPPSERVKLSEKQDGSDECRRLFRVAKRTSFVGGKDCRLRAVSDSPRTEALQRTRRRDEVGE